MKQKKYICIFFLFCLFSFGLMPKSIIQCVAQTSVDELITNARQNKANGQFTSAFKYYYQADAILSKDKNNTEKLLKNNIEIGDLCVDWKVYDKAIQYYDKAQKINASNNFSQKNQTEEILLENLVKSYEKLQKYPQATENYEKLLPLRKGTPTEAEVLKNLANNYNQQGFYDKGLARNLEILAIHQNQNNEKAQAIAYNNIGFSYKQLKNYPKSIENFKKASDIQNKLGLQNTPEHRVVLTNLAILSQNQQDFKSAKKYLFEVENLLKNTSDKANKSELADIYNLIGTTYFYTNEQENAIKYSNLAINTGKEAKNNEAQKGAHNTLSQVHSVLGQYKAALEDHILYKSISDSILQEKILLKEDILRRRSLSEDTENELKLLGVEKEIRDLDLKNVTLQAEKKEQEYKIEKQEKANQIYELEQKQLKDEARTSSLLLEKQKNETILQTQALALATQENQLKEAELKNAEITRQAQENETKKREEILLKDKKLQEQEFIHEKQAKESQRNTFGLIGLTILGLLFAMIWVYFQKRKDNIKLENQQIIILEKNKVLDEQKYQILEKNDELNATNEELISTLDTVNEQQIALQGQQLEILEKNDELNATNEELISTLDTVSIQRAELEEQNHSIVASINYAQRIQNAILPSKVNMNAFGVENFVFFKPRDIVSGDFYWFHQIDENRAIFAAMDCTGHGVPGAFTSMIGYSTFNKVVIEENTHSPEIILKKLDIYMSKALDNGDNKVMDGMDGSIILIDKQKKELYCAGAMNKIYYIQNNEFKEIEVNKHHIAGMVDADEQKIFTLTTVPLTTDTTIFMASDGYQDQFGGEKSKKFMTKNLKALLFENYQKPMDEQKNILDTTITDWITRKDEQTDDMLVMGLKIAL